LTTVNMEKEEELDFMERKKKRSIDSNRAVVIFSFVFVFGLYYCVSWLFDITHTPESIEKYIGNDVTIKVENNTNRKIDYGRYTIKPSGFLFFYANDDTITLDEARGVESDVSGVTTDISGLIGSSFSKGWGSWDKTNYFDDVLKIPDKGSKCHYQIKSNFGLFDMSNNIIISISPVGDIAKSVVYFGNSKLERSGFVFSSIDDDSVRHDVYTCDPMLSQIYLLKRVLSHEL